MTINQKLTKIQTEFKSKKSRFNSFGKYYFRSAEDILEATKPFLKELDVTVTINEELISFDPAVMQVTALISDGKAEIKSQAVVGVDLDQKGMQMPQRYGAASSYGKKLMIHKMLMQLIVMVKNKPSLKQLYLLLNYLKLKSMLKAVAN